MTARTDPPSRALRRTARHTPFAMPRTIVALILREMTSTYGRSPGGYIWMILEPVLGIALLSLIFSIGFRTPKLGDNFAIFYASGLLPFMMFVTLSSVVAQSMTYSKSLLSYPRVTYIDAILARLILNTLTQLLVSCILITAIRLTWDTRTTLDFDRILLAYSMVIALGLGIGTLNCFLFTMFPIWQRGWTIFTRPLFLVSGIIILYESVPEPYNHYSWFNPVLHIVSVARSAFYFNYEANWTSPAFVFGTAAISGVLGLVFLHRYHRDMMEL